MKAKVLITYRMYPIFLTFRAIFLVACIFIMATLDLSASDKVLLGNVFVDVILLLEVFRFYRDTKFEIKYEKMGKNEFEWRMVLATCGLGIITVI